MEKKHDILFELDTDNNDLKKEAMLTLIIGLLLLIYTITIKLY